MERSLMESAAGPAGVGLLVLLSFVSTAACQTGPLAIAPVTAELELAFDDDPFSGEADEPPADDPPADLTIDPPVEPPAEPPGPATEPRSNGTDKPEDATGEADALPAAPPAPPIDPELIRLHLVDGTVITGKFDVSELIVDTEFGRLAVPITSLQRFVPGLESRSALGGNVFRLIDDLGGGDYAQREAAHKALLGLGLPVRQQLERFRSDPNAERARHVKAIVEKLSERSMQMDPGEADTKMWIREDEVQMSDFSVVGKISPRQFAFTTPYGTLAIALGDIEDARRVLRARREDARKSLSVDGTYLAQLKYKSAGIRVERGDTISVVAEGRISRSGSSSYVSTPDGSSRFGVFSQNPTISGGTLVGRIGTGGAVVKVGSKSTFKADRAGVLQFAIGMRPDYVGSYQFLGEYKLRVVVKRASQ